MKKKLLAVVVVLFATVIYAQDLGMSMNFGVLTDKSFTFDPLVFSGGIEFDFHLGGYVMISPELNLFTDSSFASASLFLAPGVVLNFKAGPLYLGGGVVKEFSLSSGGISSPLMLKLNAGLRASKLRLGGYILTPFEDAFTVFSIGFFVGFEF